jgi:hypothetical protein
MYDMHSFANNVTVENNTTSHALDVGVGGLGSWVLVSVSVLVLVLVLVLVSVLVMVLVLVCRTCTQVYTSSLAVVDD